MDPHLLTGLKVIDCATVIAAPAAAVMLADFGAEVIKIEQPGAGDMLRILADIPTTPDAQTNWFWQLDGRNKKSLALDLKNAAGIDILQRLISQADVFITNHPYPVRHALGVTYDEVRALNENIIYASLTAYGEQGPERDRKGFDQLAYWARSGLMELMREPDTLPTQGLPGMGDHPTAVALFAGIMTALLKRERTGEGSFVHTSLLANGLWSAAGIAQGAMAGGNMPAYRETNRVNGAMLRPYKTADNRWLQLNMVRDESLFAMTLAAMDALDLLTDPRFDTPEKAWQNRAALGDCLQTVIETSNAEQWLQKFAEFDVPVNLVARIEDTLTDEQIQQNQMTVAAPDDMHLPQLIKHPVNVTSAPQVAPTRAPELGEHAEDILTSLGYSSAEIAQLRHSGVV